MKLCLSLNKISIENLFKDKIKFQRTFHSSRRSKENTTVANKNWSISCLPILHLYQFFISSSNKKNSIFGVQMMKASNRIPICILSFSLVFHYRHAMWLQINRESTLYYLLHQQLDEYFQLNVIVSWAHSFHQLSKCRNQFIYYCQQYYALLFICRMMWIVYISRWNSLVRLFKKVSMTSPRNKWNLLLLIILFDVWIKFHGNCYTRNEWSLWTIVCISIYMI